MLAADLLAAPMGEGEHVGGGVDATCSTDANYPVSAIWTAKFRSAEARQCYLDANYDFFHPQNPEPETATTRNPLARTVTVEAEPNDTITGPNNLPVDNDIEVSGTLETVGDLDIYELALNAGDIIGVNLIGGALTVSLLDDLGTEIMSMRGTAVVQAGTPANDPISIIKPDDSPLPGGGNAVIAAVIPQDGNYLVQISEPDSGTPGGAYTAQIQTFRPVLEANPVGTHQILYVDFNGATVDNAIFAPNNTGGQAPPSQFATLSPLDTFLPFWGLSPNDEDRVIDSILAQIEEDLSESLRQDGNNGDFLASRIPGEFDIEIRNSRDHADPFGLPNVSRIIVGGSEAELGITGIFGISESIDVGNFDTTETTVVLLDSFSGMIGAGSVNDLNSYPLDPSASIIDLIGRAVGNTAVHEAAHFFGLFHTDPTNTIFTNIDAGGVAPSLADELGFGPDGVFGSLDDVDVDFTADDYNPGEFFTGTLDTVNTLSFGLSTGRNFSTISGTKFHDINRNGTHDLNEPGLPGWVIYSDLNNNGIVDLREPQAVTGSNGDYSLNVAVGVHNIREVQQPGWTQTFPSSGRHRVDVTVFDESFTGIDFGNHSEFGGISGTKFLDVDADGVFDPEEPTVPGVVIYLDLDNDNRLDLGEPAAATDQNGNYSIAVPSAGTFTVRENVQPGFQITFPTNDENEHVVDVPSGGAVPGLNFGNAATDDFGDAPGTLNAAGTAPLYPTLRADGGAMHPVLPGFYLGSGVDGDGDGTPHETAGGDDINTNINDEDGIVFLDPLFPGATNVRMEVTVTSTSPVDDTPYSPGRVSLFLDFDHANVEPNGWTRDGEQVFLRYTRPDGRDASGTSVRLPEGVHTLMFDVPTWADPGLTYARARFGYQIGLGPGGTDVAGEVEDHQVRILSETPQAVADQFTVRQDTSANQLDVLLNDVPSLSGLFVSTVGQTTVDGSIVTLANGTVRYTPAPGFFGNDSFSYTITDNLSGGNTDSAEVSITVLPSFQNPIAVDDSVEMDVSDGFINIAVLDNDLDGQSPPVTLVDVQTAGSGTTVLDDRGTTNPADDLIRYTPNFGFEGTDQFTYTVEDVDGTQSTATVTVHVLPGAQQAGTDTVRFSIETWDISNTEQISGIGVGGQFRVNVYVEDLRTDDEDGEPSIDRLGVAAAYLDLLYPFELVSLLGAAEFGSDIPGQTGLYDQFTNFDTSIPGMLNESGAFQALIDDFPAPSGDGQTDSLGRADPTGANPPGQRGHLVMSIPFKANAVGTAEFTGDPPELRQGGPDPTASPDSDVLLFNPPRPVAIEEIFYDNQFGVLNIVGAGGLPLATDDFFSVPANSSQNVLDVLVNDVEVANPPLSVPPQTFSTSNGGTVAVNSDGTLLYTPRPGFNGVEQFTYTARNAVNLESVATVSVQVGSNPKEVGVRLQATDLQGNALPIDPTTGFPQVEAGQDFELRAFVQDVRNAPPDPTQTGVFAIYFDLLYNSGLVRTVNDPGNRFGFDIKFQDPYDRNGLSGSNARLNIIDEVGAFQSLQDIDGDGRTDPLGSTEYLVFVLTMNARLPGTAHFQSDPPDVTPFHDILLFDPPSTADPASVRFGSTSVTIVPAATGGPEGESPFQNPSNQYDVNNDGAESPIDVLLIVDALGNGGSRELVFGATGEGESLGQITESRTSGTYVDVNGDRILSAIDALHVVNRLNDQAQQAHAEGEGFVVTTIEPVAERGAASIRPTSDVAQVAGPPRTDDGPATVETSSDTPIDHYRVAADEAVDNRVDGQSDDSLLDDDLLLDIHQAWNELD